MGFDGLILGKEAISVFTRSLVFVVGSGTAFGRHLAIICDYLGLVVYGFRTPVPLPEARQLVMLPDPKQLDRPE